MLKCNLTEIVVVVVVVVRQCIKTYWNTESSKQVTGAWSYQFKIIYLIIIFNSNSLFILYFYLN